MSLSLKAKKTAAHHGVHFDPREKRRPVPWRERRIELANVGVGKNGAIILGRKTCRKNEKKPEGTTPTT